MPTSVTTEVTEAEEVKAEETTTEVMDDWTLLRDVIWPQRSTRFDK